MKLIYLISIFIIVNFTKTIFAQTIVVVNIQSLIDNNINYLEKIDEIEKSQLKYLSDFQIRENELKKKLIEIDESKVILNEDEINKKIDQYNNELNNFSIHVERFNFHYQEQIVNLRESVLKEIIILLEKYAIENNVDLILDSTSYLIASNSIDITELIKNELKQISMILEYKNFEKN